MLLATDTSSQGQTLNGEGMILYSYVAPQQIQNDMGMHIQKILKVQDTIMSLKWEN